MIFFISHASSFDYVGELYEPLKRSALAAQHTLIFPHEGGKTFFTKDIIARCDVFVAEVSYPSTGQGIEVGWADMYKKSIICVFKSGTQPSSSLTMITDTLIEYQNPDDMIGKLVVFFESTS